jgi:hypothetical protein
MGLNMFVFVWKPFRKQLYDAQYSVIGMIFEVKIEDGK